jgi:hypothetical protein
MDHQLLRQEIINCARQHLTASKYPIKSSNELLAAFGSTTSVTLLSETYKINDLRQIVPSDYFPIDNEEDLVFKVAQGYLSRPRVSLEFHAGQRLSTAPAGQPDIAQPPRDLPPAKGAPFHRGRKRQ